MLLDEDSKTMPHVPHWETGMMDDARDGQTAMEEQGGKYMLYEKSKQLPD